MRADADRGIDVNAPSPVPGWYPDPSGRPGLRYWDGASWTAYPPRPDHERTSTPRLLAAIVGIPVAILFGGLAAVFAVAGRGDAALGVAVLAVMVAAPTALVVLAGRGVTDVLRQRRARREYEQGLIARFDQAAPRPVWPKPRDLPDAERMREQAWQPDVHAPMAAVRPTNPAPWHVVTQYPTRQFRPAEPDQLGGRGT